MPPDALASPNPIPPRTSSTGVTTANANGSASQNYVMKPVAEDEWLASSSSSRPQGQSGNTHRQHAHSRSKSTGHHRRATSAVERERPSANASNSNNNSNSGGVNKWSADKERILLGPYDYMVQQPGKDIRRQLIAAFNRWLQVPEESLAIITRVVVMLHTASLLVDDVEDSSMLRRGVPAAHNIFGTAQTINSANYVYFLALDEIQKLKNPTAMQVYTGELLNLHRGQGLDLFWRDSLTCPSENDYLEMVGNKTGGLFRLAVKLMQAESEVEIDCMPLVNVMGLVFQVCDDYLNLSNPSYSQNKGLCEDFTEGKFSFPIIHSIRSDPHNLQLINILQQKTRDDEVKRYAISYMESTGSFAYTRKVVAQLRDKALTAIDGVEATLGGGAAVASEHAGADSMRAILDRIVQPTLQTAGSGKDKS